MTEISARERNNKGREKSDKKTGIKIEKNKKEKRVRGGESDRKTGIKSKKAKKRYTWIEQY